MATRLMLQLRDPQLVDCVDCGAIHGDQCYPCPPGSSCIGRGNLLARVALGNVTSFAIDRDGRVREWNAPRVKGARKAMSPIRCTACGQVGHNLRNPRCPAKTSIIP
jgi:hypothetical protein